MKYLIPSEPKLCQACGRKAHRIMPNGTALCDDHYRDAIGVPRLKKPGHANQRALLHADDSKPAGSAA